MHKLLCVPRTFGRDCMYALILWGTTQTLEMLDGMLDSSNNTEQGSTEQSRVKVSKAVLCSVKCWIRMTRALRDTVTSEGKYLITRYCY